MKLHVAAMAMGDYNSGPVWKPYACIHADSYGTRATAYQAVDNYVYACVRHFLRRRHKVQSRGTTRFSMEAVFGELGVIKLRRIQMASRS